MSDTEIRQAFKAFDKDGNGFICAEELRQLMTDLGLTLTDADIKEMMSEADVDGDGNISYDEFVKIWDLIKAK